MLKQRVLTAAVLLARAAAGAVPRRAVAVRAVHAGRRSRAAGWEWARLNGAAGAAAIARRRRRRRALVRRGAAARLDAGAARRAGGWRSAAGSLGGALALRGGAGRLAARRRRRALVVGLRAARGRLARAGRMRAGARPQLHAVGRSAWSGSPTSPPISAAAPSAGASWRRRSARARPGRASGAAWPARCARRAVLPRRSTARSASIRRSLFTRLADRFGVAAWCVRAGLPGGDERRRRPVRVAGQAQRRRQGQQRAAARPRRRARPHRRAAAGVPVASRWRWRDAHACPSDRAGSGLHPRRHRLDRHQHAGRGARAIPTASRSSR